jgi:predicted nucleic acid-binding protein
MFEYDDVTSRLGLLPHFHPTDIHDFLDWFTSISSLHKVYFLWRPLLKDPKDDMVLECAISARAHYIVTYNLSDFLKAESLGVKVVTPSKLLEILTKIRS